MDAALAALLTDTVLHAAYVGQDNYGKPQYGTPVARPARVEYSTQTLVIGATGDIVNQTLVYLNADFAIDERDKITLADGSSSSISQIERWTDEYGQPDYYRLHL